MELKGEVTTGLGKGKYYMSKKVYQEAFNKKIGFKPFPGTLNLKVDEKTRKKFEEKGKTLKIREVYEAEERLSNVDITPCKIGDIKCGLLKLEFTDHPENIAEVIAPIELREKFNLQDGDKITMNHTENINREKFREKATEATLCFIIQNEKTLLIEKKRGVGEGLYNGPGGKKENNETPKECAIRETKEETTVTPQQIEKMGELEFMFGEKPFMYVHILKATDYTGKPDETEEARPEWFKTDELPYEEMWPDDKHWIPKMLKNEKFTARFQFDQDGEKIQNHRFEEPTF